MGEAYGWSEDGRKVFDPVVLEQAAASLRQQNSGTELLQQLQDRLMPIEMFGNIRGANEARSRLSDMFDSLRQEMSKVGIDLSDLASRALAAGDLARAVDARTRAAAGGHYYIE